MKYITVLVSGSMLELGADAPAIFLVVNTESKSAIARTSTLAAAQLIADSLNTP